MAQQKPKQSLVAYIAVLFVFSLIADYMIITQQRRLILDQANAYNKNELQLISALTKEALIKGDYVTASEYLNEWGKDNPDIIEVSIVKSNQFKLSHFTRPVDSDNTLTLSDNIQYHDNAAVITLTKDMTPLETELYDFLIKLVLASVLFTSFFGFLLWNTLQKTAFTPLNKEIKTRQRAEEELKRSNDELEQRVAERTQQLTRQSRDLEQTINELENKNAELERFTYTVSHDLKSPLVTIKGFLGLIAKDIDSNNSERAKNDLARIDAATGNMQHLLDDLLELSRIGRVTNPLERVNYNDIIEKTLSILDTEIKNRNAEIIIDNPLHDIFCDRERLIEVTQNLISNAIKFTHTDTDPIIHIGSQSSNNEALIYIKDNGEGIDAAYQQKIFEIFERLNPRVHGTGIGLAIVRRIIEFHDGKIWVESAGENQGSSFYFTLPGQALE